MLRIAPLIWIVLGTTLAGSLMLVVVSVPSLASQDVRLIPYAVASGFLIAVPLAISDRPQDPGRHDWSCMTPTLT